MYKSTTKCNETIGKWCKNKHGASKIIDTFETYQWLKIGSGTTENSWPIQGMVTIEKKKPILVGKGL
jgi:hypothetical protein